MKRKMAMISIALLGFGCVGSGTAEVLTENKRIIEERLGVEYQIKYILDLRDFPDSPFGGKVVHDFNTIVEDSEVTVVAEMMGGSHPAYDFTKACLKAGKSVVTSNKEVVAKYGVELCALAQENGVRYMFEASVGGGIPVIRPLMTDLASNKILSINGILNGTTNYILTQMRDNGSTFEAALKEAQAMGYAEANPAADVDGIDAARKTAILAAIMSGKLISPDKISTEGISKIELCHVMAVQKLGYSIKLIGHAEEKNGKLLALVSPMAVPASNPLSRIDDVFNGILVNANMVGDVMFYGPGAGKLPTASAVVADIVDIISKRDVEPSAVAWTAAEEEDIAAISEYASKRMVIRKDGDSLVATVTDILSEDEAEALAASDDSIVKIYKAL